MKYLIPIIVLILVLSGNQLIAQTLPSVPFDLDSFTDSIQFSSTINLLLVISSIGLIPFFLISSTSFIKTIVVLGMIRAAIGTQQSPPNPILIALALFLTIYVMTPTWNQVQKTALIPYQQEKITQGKAISEAIKPLRSFMLKFTREKDLALFLEFSTTAKPSTLDEVPLSAILPAFIISELRSAFQIGFLLYIPFVVIDLIVSNILLSLGMFMLSPVMVSMPFKILLFVTADGWNLITKGLLLSYK